MALHGSLNYISNLRVYVCKPKWSCFEYHLLSKNQAISQTEFVLVVVSEKELGKKKKKKRKLLANYR